MHTGRRQHEWFPEINRRGKPARCGASAGEGWVTRSDVALWGKLWQILGAFMSFLENIDHIRTPIDRPVLVSTCACHALPLLILNRIFT